jgi:hypothetical protein
MTEIFSQINYKDNSLHETIKKEADKKFGSENSYVKNLWIHKEYKKRGGKAAYKGKKPSNKEIKNQVKAEMLDFNDSILEDLEEEV